MEEKIYKSTVKGKVKFYSLIIILLSLAILMESNWFDQLISIDTNGYTIEQSKPHIIKRTNILIFLGSVFLLINFGLAILLYRFGRKIHRTQQFPPPGVDIPFSMKIKQGKKALRQAYATYFVSAFFIAHGILKLVFSVHIASIIKFYLDVI